MYFSLILLEYNLITASCKEQMRTANHRGREKMMPWPREGGERPPQWPSTEACQWGAASPDARGTSFCWTGMNVAVLARCRNAQYLQTDLSFSRCWSVTRSHPHPRQGSAEQPHLDSGETDNRKEGSRGQPVIAHPTVQTDCTHNPFPFQRVPTAHRMWV